MVAQRGSVFKRHGSWYVRNNVQIVENGVTKRKQPVIWLARSEDYPKKSEVLALAAEKMATVNRTAKSSDPGVKVVACFEKVFVPPRKMKRTQVLYMTRPRGNSSYSDSPGTLPPSRHRSHTSMWLAVVECR